MDKEELRKRTKDFAHRCVKLALNLPNTILGRYIQGQLIFIASRKTIQTKKNNK